MDKFLQVNNNSSTNLPSSPTNSFIADEVASICPLITPSPPTNDLINPLPEPSKANFTIGEELATILQHVQDKDKSAGDSASSSSSALAEPACTQLLNHRNSTYHHITKDDDTATEETAGKVQPLQLTFRNPPENYFFMSWNWPLLRKISLWTFMAGLAAMVALVIAMIWTLPKKCDPQVEWYQGSVMYEVFPASFYDSNNDQVGDFKGMSLKADYMISLGIRAVRLNSIFETVHYPDDYKNASTLIQIAPQLGNLTDFKILRKHLQSRNISLLLDLPVFPVMKQLVSTKIDQFSNNTNLEPSIEFLRTVPTIDLVEEALIYWKNNGVDGFYLKGLEYFANDPNLAQSLRRWKKIVGSDRPFIVGEAFINTVPREIINTVLDNVDLVDVRLEIEKGVSPVSKQIENIQNGTLFSRPGLPWVHWNLGDESSNRLANVLPNSNATLGATLLQLMLPGTLSIFYGNEVGLQQLSNSDQSNLEADHHNLGQLAPMIWPNKAKQVLMWIHGEEAPTNFAQVNLIKEMVGLRNRSPAIYINSIYKEEDNKANADVKYSSRDLLVIQRWYPRRKSYVVVCNLGNSTVTADLSTILYSGTIVIGPRPESKSETISFKNISLCPGDSVVIQLD